MFQTVLGKRCLKNPSCTLHGQMQDAGLSLCPECACELTTIKRIDLRMAVAAAVVGLVITSLSSVLSYGFFVYRFTPMQTLKWVMGQLKRVDRLEFGKDGWLSGNLAWWNADGTVMQNSQKYLYERVNSRHQLRPDFTAGQDEWLRFDLASKVDYTYVLYRAPDKPQLLFSPRNKHRDGTIQIPQGPAKAIRLTGPAATEHFILIASRRPVADLNDARSVPSGERLDSIVGQLEQDRENAAVYHVMIPHN